MDFPELDLDVNQQSFQSRAIQDPFGLGESATFADSFMFHLTQVVDEFPAWSIYPGRRDRDLRKFWKTEPTIAGAVYSSAAWGKGLENQLFGDEEQNEFAEDLLRSADFGAGHRTLVEKTIIDYHTQDNGTFWEKVGAGDPLGPLIGAVRQINYLDPAQCLRTFDWEFPILYTNPITHDIHKIHHSRVVMRSSMTQPNELARGVGLSSLSRALQSVQTIKDIHVYRHEKVSGNFKRGVGFGKGITAKTLQRVLGDANVADESAGFTRFNGIPFVVSVQGVELSILDLASLPDGFDLETDTTLYIYILALCFGVDAREFWPATQSGATKADASIQSQKARGKGKADLIRTVEGMFRECLPDGTNFTYDFNDDEHDQRVAVMDQVTVQTLSIAKRDEAITAREYRAIMLKNDIAGLSEELIKNMDSMPGLQDFEEPQPRPRQLALPFGNPGHNSSHTEDEPPDEDEKKKRLRTPFAGFYEMKTNEFQVFLESLMQEKLIEIGGMSNVDPQTASEWVDEFGNLMLLIFAEQVTEAYGVGLAGLNPTDIGLITLQENYRREMNIFDGFIGTLRSKFIAGLVLGLVGVELGDSMSGLVNRLGLYTSTYWTSIWIGLEDMLSQDVMAALQPRKVRRVLDSQAAHCNTCPPKAGIYDSFATMISFTQGLPGDLSDECGSNCRCWIEVETKSGSGVFIRWNGEPTTFSEPVVVLPAPY